MATGKLKVTSPQPKRSAQETPLMQTRQLVGKVRPNVQLQDSTNKVGPKFGAVFPPSKMAWQHHMFSGTIAIVTS